MKTVLVLAQHPELAESIRAGLNSDTYRVIHRLSLEEAEPLLHYGLLNACFVDVELTNVQGIWMIEKLRKLLPNCPILVYTGPKQWEWEEEAYLKGVAHVLAKPVRSRLLNALLDRIFSKAPPALMRPAIVPLPPPPASRQFEGGYGSSAVPQNAFQ